MLPTEPEVTPPYSRILDVPTALFLLAALIFLYSFLFIPPFLPVHLSGDNLLCLAAGQRMYEGEMIYRDVFEFVTPGTALIYLSLFKLFGLRLWIPNLLSLFLGLGLVWLGVVIAKKVMRPNLALLPSAIFLVGCREFLCDPTHHWFSVLAATAAIAVLLERRSPARIAGAGFLCGLCACFTQAHGLAVAAGFGVFLWWESRRRQEDWRKLLKKETWLVTSFLTTLIALNGYFVWKAGLARFLWCTAVFGIKYYSKQTDFNTFQVFTDNLPKFFPLSSFHSGYLARWLFLYVIPFILILFFARYCRESVQKPVEFWARPMLVALVGFFLFLSVAPAPARSRMAVCELPPLILLGWLIDSHRKFARAFAALLGAGVLLASLHDVAKWRPVPVGILATPQGKLAFTDEDPIEMDDWIQRHTSPLDYFYRPSDAAQYFTLNLRNPTPSSFIVDNGYTRPEQVEGVIRGLEQHHVRYILWSSRLDIIPKWEDPSDDHLGPLRGYIHSHYQRVEVTAISDEVWEREN